MTSIKSMQLYTHLERISNELAESGKSINDALQVSDLTPFDQLHYHGTDALDTALELCNAQANQNWLEIGSGLGGPSRYLAQQGQLNILALELQPDQNNLASQLTKACNLDSRVNHQCGDFLTYPLDPEHYETIVSWLAIYHVPNRPLLLKRSHDCLKTGGYFYTEDLYQRAPFSNEAREDIERELFATTLPEFDVYQQQFKDSGFEIISLEEMSDDWSAFTNERLKAYKNDRERHVRVHGEATVKAMDQFYSSVDRHFQSGCLGGLRLCARRI